MTDVLINVMTAIATLWAVLAFCVLGNRALDVASMGRDMKNTAGPIAALTFSVALATVGYTLISMRG